MRIAVQIQQIAAKPLVRKSFLALLDQGLLSALNFLMTIILIKTVAKSTFGYYSIAISVSLLAVSLQNALVTTPLTVLYGSKSRRGYLEHANALFRGQYRLIFPLVVAGLVVAAIWYWLDLDSEQAAIIAAVSLAAIGILYREFFRAFFYADEAPGKVLRLDIRYAICYVSLVMLAVALDFISVAIVFLFIGFSALVAAGFRQPGVEPANRRQQIKESYRENWELGKWALVGVIATHIQRYCYLYLLGFMIGSHAAADATASRLILTPFVLIIAGWGQVSRPHGVRLREAGNIQRYSRELMFAAAGLGVIILGYVLVIDSFAPYLTSWLLTENYADSLRYVALWGGIFAVTFLRMNASFGLQVLKQFKILAQANIVTMIITIISAVIMIHHYNIFGALAALLTGEIVFALLLWHQLLRRVRKLT